MGWSIPYCTVKKKRKIAIFFPALDKNTAMAAAAAAPTSFTPPSQPFPTDLRHDLPDHDLLWAHSERVTELMKASSPPKTGLHFRKVLLLPTDKEFRFVWRFFHHDKPTRYALKKIHAVNERHQREVFEAHMGLLEREVRAHQIERDGWETEPRAEQRRVVMQRWDDETLPFSDFQTAEKDGRKRTWSHVRVLPMWHGTSAGKCEAICNAGFTFFGKTTLEGGWLCVCVCVRECLGVCVCVCVCVCVSDSLFQI